MSDHTKGGNPYLVGSIAGVFARTAAPIVLFMLVSGLFTVVDAVFLGRFAGTKALTAVTLVFPIMMLMVALQSMVSSGMASIMARQIGAGDIRAAEGTVFAASLLSAIVCVGLMGGLAVTGRSLTTALAGGDAEIAHMALVFTAVMVVFSPFSFFLNIQSDSLRSEGKAGTMALIAIGVTLLNILFNYLLIAIFGLGVAGSAFGTVGAQVIAIAACVWLRTSGRTPLPLIARGTGSVVGDWRGILALGAPPSLGFLGISLSSGLIIAQIQVWDVTGGADTVAAFGVINRVMTFAYLPLMGASMACQSIAGNNHGAGRHDRVAATLRIGFGFALVYAVAYEVAFLTLPHLLGSAFVDDAAVIAEVVRIMPVTSVTYVLSAPLVIVGGYYQALGMAGSAAVLNLVRTYVIGLPLLTVMPMLFGEIGIWTAYPTGDVVMLGVVAGVLAWNARRNGLAWGLFRHAGSAAA
jgi:putative MATE family efflux protein